LTAGGTLVRIIAVKIVVAVIAQAVGDGMVRR